MTGKWNIEISFADGARQSLRFEAQGEGKGRLEMLDPRAKAWGVQRRGRQNGTWARKTMLPFPALWNFFSATSAAMRGR
jgi:hypothetical protein